LASVYESSKQAISNLEPLNKEMKVATFSNPPVGTTHSPFMIASDSLNRVRTVLETDTVLKKLLILIKY
jgi:hypothetical protein